MKRLKFLALSVLTLVVFGCSENNDVLAEQVSITFNFTHLWEGVAIETSDFGNTTFTNANGTDLIINDVRYIISDISLTHKSGVVTSLDEYVLVDVDDETGLTFTTSQSILPGDYTNLTFRFGLSEEDNTTNAYPDLTSANFDVGSDLGGGYHYMQMNGTYINSNSVQSPFNFHTIAAIDTSVPVADRVREDTSINFSIGPVSVESNTNINLSVDLSGWFTNPNTWDLNFFDTALMGNYEAQQDMFENGQLSVFSLNDITQE